MLCRSLIYGVSIDEVVGSKVEKMLLELNEFCTSDSSSSKDFRLKAGVLCAAQDSNSK